MDEKNLGVVRLVFELLRIELFAPHGRCSGTSARFAMCLGGLIEGYVMKKIAEVLWSTSETLIVIGCQMYFFCTATCGSFITLCFPK